MTTDVSKSNTLSDNETTGQQNKRFKCDQCDKSYTQRTKLRFHQANIHGVGEYPTSCSYCGKKLSSKSAKNEHEASVHRGARQFQCDFCDQRFSRAAFLYGHKRSHHNALKLKCDRCQMTFSFMQSLIEHKGQCGKSEAEREKHNCSLCDASFTTKRAAKLHEASSHGDHRHMCEQCGESYRYKSSYRKHKKEKH